MIIKCNCPDSGPGAVYQTKKYGVGKRVGTISVRTSGKYSKCTVCGKEHKVG